MYYCTFEQKAITVTSINKDPQKTNLTFSQKICKKTCRRIRKQKRSSQRSKKNKLATIWGEPSLGSSVCLDLLFSLPFWVGLLLFFVPFHKFFIFFSSFFHLHRCLSPRVRLQVVSLVHLLVFRFSFFALFFSSFFAFLRFVLLEIQYDEF